MSIEQTLKDELNNLISNGRVSAFTLTAEKINSEPSLIKAFEIKAVQDPYANPVLTLIPAYYGGTRIAANLSWNEIKLFNDHLIGLSYANYRKVKNDSDWANVYDIGVVNFEMRHKDGTIGSIQLDATYCAGCGVLLPIRNLHVDHQAPKKGGEYSAILRMFRHYGLTESGPKGRKGALSIGRTSGTTLNDRYTLNAQGILMFSAYVYAGLEGELKTRCVNHFWNFSPKCGYCNSSKGNR